MFQLGYCWGQCVGTQAGDQEWCYHAQRQLGPTVDYTCDDDSDCIIEGGLFVIKCSGECGQS